MYQDAIVTQEEAVSHLFLHCCFRDNVFTESEIASISNTLVTAGLQTSLNFKEEVVTYKAYRQDIDDEQAYLEHLISTIMPANELALFSYCVELCLSDTALSREEERMLDSIAALLHIESPEKETIKKLVLQRKVVETQKLF